MPASKKTSLKNTLKDAFMRHSEKITSLSYLFATSTLLIKNMMGNDFLQRLATDFQTQMDVAAAIPFYISSTCYYFAEKNPKLFIKTAGANVVVASTLLAAGGYRGDMQDTSFHLHIASMLPTAWAGAALFLEKRTVGAIPELLSRPLYAAAGIAQGDWGQVAFAVTGACGEIGLIATDKKLKSACLTPQNN